MGTPGSKDSESNVLHSLATGEECMSRNGSDITGSSVHIPSVHQEEVKWYVVQRALIILEQRDERRDFSLVKI